MCDPQKRTLPPGRVDEPMEVQLHVKEAVLIINADPNAKIGIQEYPSLKVTPGRPIKVVVPSVRFLTVVDLANPSRTKKVDKLKFGETFTVDF
jgi:hypothetical protein